ncbi:MAG: response regulator transcription factor [Rhodocyclales bacterium]|nr:response regulator transcription factor [Rhodocyclales bacterium]
MDSALNIIVVEDHDELREVTVAALCGMGHVVRGVDCAEALDDELGAFRADILVLDLNLPGEDGISVARRMRAAGPDIGIIMVTAREAVRDKMTGYGSGADIYLTKPTSVEELGAAIQALSRRIRPDAPLAGQLTLNPVTLQLHGPRAVLDVSDQECALLSAFAKAAEHRLESWQMMELSGKGADEVSKSTLEVQIVRLRKKLEEAGAATPTIKAIRGRGYQLCVPLVVRSAAVAEGRM